MILFDYRLLNGCLVSNQALFYSLLSDAERAELFRRNYRHKLRSAQYLYSRLSLRFMLACALHLDFSSISIVSSASGCPRALYNGVVLDNCSVSISHGCNLVLVSACFGCRSGIDIQTFYGIDWNSVVAYMGWEASARNSFEEIISTTPALVLPLSVFYAMIWSAYEAWMKMTDCIFSSDFFSWRSIRLVTASTGNFNSVFEMTLDCRASSAPRARVVIGHLSDLVIAVAHDSLL